MKSFNLIVVVVYCIYQFPLILTQTPTDGSVRIIDEDDQGGRCENLPTTPPSRCLSVGYTSAYYPNFRDHENQLQAQTEFITFFQLIESGCSEFLLDFLCGYYFPFCYTSSNGVARLRPCRSLCEAARQNCSQVLSDNSPFEWPTFLNCSLDTFQCESSSCFGPQDLPTPSSCIVVTTVGDETTTETATETTTTATMVRYGFCTSYLG